MVLSELNTLSELLLEEFRKELKDQGHNLTGKLSKSLQIRTTAGAGEISLIGSFLRYGAAIDQGVKPERVPFTPNSGNKTSKYITGLINFVKLRRIATNDAKAKSIAFAIAFKHKKEGIPTKSSYKYSSNGRRLGWISDTLDRNSDTITELLQDIFEKEVNINIDNLLNKYNL